MEVNGLVFSADNRTKRRRKNITSENRKDFTVFADKTDKNKVRMSPQLTLAAYQYLSTSKYMVT